MCRIACRNVPAAFAWLTDWNPVSASRDPTIPRPKAANSAANCQERINRACERRSPPRYARMFHSFQLVPPPEQLLPEMNNPAWGDLATAAIYRSIKRVNNPLSAESFFDLWEKQFAFTLPPRMESSLEPLTLVRICVSEAKTIFHFVMKIHTRRLFLDYSFFRNY